MKLTAQGQYWSVAINERERRVLRDAVLAFWPHHDAEFNDITEAECYAAWIALAGAQSPGAFSETSPNAYSKGNVVT